MEAVFNQRLREPIIRMHPEATASELAMVNVKTLCARRVPQLRGICAIYRNLFRIRILAAGLAAAWMLAVWGFFAMNRAEGDRRKKISELAAKWRVSAVAVYAGANLGIAAACLYFVSEVFQEHRNRLFFSVSGFLALALVGGRSLYMNARIKEAARIV